MKRDAQRGYTMMEIVVTLAVFGVFLFIIVILTAEMKSQEKKYPVNYMSHPDTSAVVTRMRRDVYDAMYLPLNYDKYDRSPKVVILYCSRQGHGETIVYDFRTAGEARRMTFSAGAMTSDWVAHSVPDFTADYERDVSALERTATIALTAVDAKGRTSIDEILFKRPTAAPPADTSTPPTTT